MPKNGKSPSSPLLRSQMTAVAMVVASICRHRVHNASCELSIHLSTCVPKTCSASRAPGEPGGGNKLVYKRYCCCSPIATSKSTAGRLGCCGGNCSNVAMSLSTNSCRKDYPAQVSGWAPLHYTLDSSSARPDVNVAGLLLGQCQVIHMKAINCRVGSYPAILCSRNLWQHNIRWKNSSIIDLQIPLQLIFDGLSEEFKSLISHDVRSQIFWSLLQKCITM
jgi:hypothetical protein